MIEIPSHDLVAVKRDLSFHLENLKIRYDFVAQNGTQLQKALTGLGVSTEENMQDRTRIANECAIQFRASANALTAVSAANPKSNLKN